MSWNSEIGFRWGPLGPTDAQIEEALTGVYGPVRYSFRLEKRNVRNQLRADLTAALIGGDVSLNNDRSVIRKATLILDPDFHSQSLPPSINVLSDHVAIFLDLLVDNEVWQEFQLGLFQLHLPHRKLTPGDTTREWKVQASDLTLHLIEDGPNSSYTVQAGENYIDEVETILNFKGLTRHTLPATDLTLPSDMVWRTGDTWLKVINDLLHAINMYSIWPDETGRFRTRPRADFDSEPTSVIYTEDDWVAPPATKEEEDTRLANQVVVVRDDPSLPIISATATNSDPNSPTSTVVLGRTIQKVLHRSGSPDQATLKEEAEYELARSGSTYQRGRMSTSIDPRRGAHEIYQITVPDFSPTGERWWARNWKMKLSVGAPMTHQVANVKPVLDAGEVDYYYIQPIVVYASDDTPVADSAAVIDDAYAQWQSWWAFESGMSFNLEHCIVYISPTTNAGLITAYGTGFGLSLGLFNEMHAAGVIDNFDPRVGKFLIVPSMSAGGGMVGSENLGAPFILPGLVSTPAGDACILLNVAPSTYGWGAQPWWFEIQRQAIGSQAHEAGHLLGDGVAQPLPHVPPETPGNIMAAPAQWPSWPEVRFNEEQIQILSNSPFLSGGPSLPNRLDGRTTFTNIGSLVPFGVMSPAKGFAAFTASGAFDASGTITP